MAPNGAWQCFLPDYPSRRTPKVILQPQTSADAVMNKSKDKFLIQTAVDRATDVDASLTPVSLPRPRTAAHAHRRPVLS